jgi:hypothetical protein
MSEAVLIVVLSGAAALCWRCHPRRTGLAALFGGLAALMVRNLVATVTAAGWLAAVLAILILLAVATGVGWYRFTHHRSRMRRWGRAVRRKHGMASTLDVLRYGSALAMRRQATRVRPSLLDLALRQRLALPVTEFAVSLCRAGALRIWASIEDVVLVFGIPRYGKSAWLGCHILDAPGPVVTTSTKPDLYRATHKLRPGPSWLFNVTGVGGLPSTLRFDPVIGCRDTVTAGNRAEDMLPCGAGGDGEREHWVFQARDALAGLLHAAALGGLPMQAIAEWVADPDHAADDVDRLLAGSDDPTHAYATAARQFFNTNDRTRSSITASMRPALAWLPNPHARAATTTSHGTGGSQFSVEELLRTRGTVYLLGAEDGSTASLVAALTGYIAREARRIADLQPSGRLDPSLLLALDEAALICPIPLDRWSADMGGRGIQIIACFQSRSQAIGKWGTAGAGELINNAGAVVLYGGCKDEADLRFWSSLFGDRDEEVATADPQGQVISRGLRRVPVFTPSQLAALPKFKVVVWRSSMAPVLGRVDKFWTRRAYRDQLAALQQAEQDVLADATATTRNARPTRTGLAATLRRGREQRQFKTTQSRGRGQL